MALSPEQAASGFLPAHGDLPHAAGVPGPVASESYIESLRGVVSYWASPGVDPFGRELFPDVVRVE